MAQRGRPPIPEAEALRRIDNAINAMNKRAERTFRSLGPNSQEYTKLLNYLKGRALKYGVRTYTKNGAIQLSRSKADMLQHDIYTGAVDTQRTVAFAAELNNWAANNYHTDQAIKSYRAHVKSKATGRMTRAEMQAAIQKVAEQRRQNIYDIDRNLQTLYKYQGQNVPGVDEAITTWREKRVKTYDEIDELADIAAFAADYAKQKGLTPNQRNVTSVTPIVPIPDNLYDSPEYQAALNKDI